MCLEVGGPAEVEEADGHEVRARYHQRNAELGTANVVVSCVSAWHGAHLGVTMCR